MDVIILDAHRPEDGRINRHVKYLVDQGLNVFRINYNFLDEYAKSGTFSKSGEKGFRINLLSSNGKTRTALFLLYCMRRRIMADSLNALRALNFDIGAPSVIHIHDPQLLPLAGLLISNDLSNSKVIYDRHEIYEKLIKYFGIPIFALYEYFGKKYISGLVIVSDHHLGTTRKVFPKPYVVTVPNYPASAISDSIINNKIGSLNADTQINAVYVGGLNNLLDRDVDLLISIADATLQSYDNVNFIVGGTDLDAQSKMKIDDLSKKNCGRFHFLGYVPREKTVELTQKAHIGFFLMRPDTSYWVKASPNKVFEYLMCGTVPIIRADVDNADALKRCSLIFDRFDDDDVIVNAVLDLVSNPGRLKDLMIAAKDLSTDYTWESVACRYIDLYKILLSPGDLLKSSTKGLSLPPMGERSDGPK